MKESLTRRGFLAGATALAGSASLLETGCRSLTGSGERFAVFISDLHVPAWPSFQRDRLERTVNEILAMKPLPTNVVVFGDIAFHCGLPEEYAVSKALLKRLADAGIELSFGMGNHDRRSAFLDAWPEYRDKTLLPGHLVTRTDLGAVDLLMIDGLQGKDDRSRNDMGPVSGALSKAHQEWLVEELGRLKKPTFIASHYTIGDKYEVGEMNLGGKPIVETFLKYPMVIGYLHGHAHLWYQDWYHDTWDEKAREFRTACLPSTGHWGDIGYAIFTAESGHAELRLVQREYYFPAPRPEAECPPTWKSIVADHQNRVVCWDW